MYVFLVLGVLLAAAAWLMYIAWPESRWAEKVGDSLLSIGFVVLTVVILQFLWGILGGEPIERTLGELTQTVRLVEDGHVTGVRRVWTKAGSYGSEDDWLEVLRTARRGGKVDLMGYTLSSWLAGDFRETVKELLARDVSVRALAMDPSNPLFALRGNPDLHEQSQARLRADADAVEQVLARLNAEAVDTPIEYRRVLDGSVKWQITRVDGVMLLIPYMHSTIGSSCPMLRVVETEGDAGLFDSFAREFETLWESAERAPATTEGLDTKPADEPPVTEDAN